jgi:hypothetical protein
MVVRGPVRVVDLSVTLTPLERQSEHGIARSIEARWGAEVRVSRDRDGNDGCDKSALE